MTEHVRAPFGERDACMYGATPNERRYRGWITQGHKWSLQSQKYLGHPYAWSTMPQVVYETLAYFMRERHHDRLSALHGRKVNLISPPVDVSESQLPYLL